MASNSGARVLTSWEHVAHLEEKARMKKEEAEKKKERERQS